MDEGAIRANVFLGQVKALERARPMCPDHRDKFAHVPCIACHFEAQLTATERERDKAERLIKIFDADLDTMTEQIIALTTERDGLRGAVREAAAMIENMLKDCTYYPEPGMNRWLALPSVQQAVEEKS